LRGDARLVSGGRRPFVDRHCSVKESEASMADALCPEKLEVFL